MADFGWLTLGAVAAVAVLVLVLIRLRWNLERRTRVSAGVPPKRSWHVEATDPVSRLRTPYKPDPMCPRCLSVGRPGERAFFVCRLNESCGLLEEERTGPY